MSNMPYVIKNNIIYANSGSACRETNRADKGKSDGYVWRSGHWRYRNGRWHPEWYNYRPGWEFHIEYSICQCDDYGFLRRLYVPDREGTARQSLSVILKEDTKTLDEIVVVGFGTQKKVNLTGSVSTVNAEDLLSRPVSNVSQALQGLVPGMNFSYASDGNGGEIGADMKVNIRGAGTIGDGSNASPLILIDGMEGNMNMLNPNDIESISVLKDAAASSIYGSRAPFGVVLITTKKGKAGKVNINYNNSFRWSEAINLPDVADAYTYAMYFNKMQLNDGKTAVQFDDTRLQAIKDYASGTITTTTQPNRNTPTIWDWIGNTNTDWYDVVFGGTAFSQEHSLSVSGGTEKYSIISPATIWDRKE